MDENDEEEGTVVVPMAERKRREAMARKRRAGMEITSESSTSSKQAKTLLPITTMATVDESAVKTTPVTEAISPDAETIPVPEQRESLLSIHRRNQQEAEADPEQARRAKRDEEEGRILESALAASTQALVSAHEKAHDVRFKERIRRRWINGFIPEQAEVTRSIRESKLILVEGVDVPPPVSRFEHMNLPSNVVSWLAQKKEITTPSPIQMQGMPVVLSGRDMIGVASTGSGKTLSFLIPAVVCCLEQEDIAGRLGPGRGPFVLILGPSRELQRQTFQIAEEMSEYAFSKRLSITLAIGGEDKLAQISNHRHKGSHILIGTPGRVLDFLGRGDIFLSMCTLLVLDEGDKMMDEGFDEDVKKIIGHFKQRSRQTVLFSATMPKRVVEFARDALVDAVVVNVGRAGAASANINQFIELVDKDDRFLKLLEALERTAPPVLIFCTKNDDVDDVHEYLLLKGLEARGIHAGKSQQDRNQAVDDFKSGVADVLVASDVAAKGLDFTKIEHVINFDMPAEIEQYIHRIGRTGRGGNKGAATTFIDPAKSKPTVLKDLFGVLKDAKQRAPLFLVGGEEGTYDEPEDASKGENREESLTCSVCGGFGHRVTSCPRLAQIGKKNLTRDVVTGGDY